MGQADNLTAGFSRIIKLSETRYDIFVQLIDNTQLQALNNWFYHSSNQWKIQIFGMLLRIVFFACLIAFSYGRKVKIARRPTGQTTTLAPVSNQPCIKEDGQQGECVPYFLCTNGDTINQDGSYVIDTRFKLLEKVIKL